MFNKRGKQIRNFVNVCVCACVCMNVLLSGSRTINGKTTPKNMRVSLCFSRAKWTRKMQRRVESFERRKKISVYAFMVEYGRVWECASG